MEEIIMLADNSINRLQKIFLDEGINFTTKETKSIGELLISMGEILKINIKDEYDKVATRVIN